MSSDNEITMMFQIIHKFNVNFLTNVKNVNIF